MEGYGNKEGITQYINEWIEIARNINERVNENENGGQDYYFDNSLYNVQEFMGFTKHAFILSMYALMKVDSKGVDKAYNWAMY